jgi:hypothetical protein
METQLMVYAPERQEQGSALAEHLHLAMTEEPNAALYLRLDEQGLT